ncbi:hypothetical protein P5G65_11630 [Paenibacillus chondroitinus]|uniref:Uncharacterized protein n=1 Tax=Paenibacillus chondroitinus TaxID=59842 RepID=A0ABU6DAQ6_9BACL|nr:MULTISPECIES: hypothetical protein [Paenibacillus]MCY9656901.1 hypothetical protein [Paenibacillus anseongense]MEB4794551.1 hypothetical protein [Paenibacillus chondroitinus]
MNKTLITDMQLFAAALSQANVAVIQCTADDIPVFLAVGKIRKYTPFEVQIGEISYLREESEFRIKED